MTSSSPPLTRHFSSYFFCLSMWFVPPENSLMKPDVSLFFKLFIWQRRGVFEKTSSAGKCIASIFSALCVFLWLFFPDGRCLRHPSTSVMSTEQVIYRQLCFPPRESCPLQFSPSFKIKLRHAAEKQEQREDKKSKQTVSALRNKLSSSLMRWARKQFSFLGRRTMNKCGKFIRYHPEL